MPARTLIIAGVPIGIDEFPASQTFRKVQGSAILRMQDGTAVKQTQWEKIATHITGAGFAPPALAGVDWKTSFEISCVAPMSLYSPSNIATIPSARRTDIGDQVLAFGVVGGMNIITPVSVVGDTATATPVSGATGYKFWYYPKLTFFSFGPSERLDTAGGGNSWSIDAEEA